MKFNLLARQGVGKEGCVSLSSNSFLRLSVIFFDAKLMVIVFNVHFNFG